MGINKASIHPANRLAFIQVPPSVPPRTSPLVSTYPPNVPFKANSFIIIVVQSFNAWSGGGGYLHQITHGVLHLLHGGSEAGLLVPAAGHQGLDGLGQIFDQRRPSSYRAGEGS